MSRCQWIIVLTVLGLAAGAGCSKTAPESPNAKNNGSCSPEFLGDTVTYDGYVRHVLITYCTPNCHNGGPFAPGDFRTYQGVRPYTGQFIYRVIGAQADMPLDMAPLPETIRDSLNIWIKNCAPEK